MDQLNRYLTLLVGAAVALTLFAAGSRSPEPINEPWFAETVLENSLPVVVKFGAEWCGPCRGMDKALDQLEPEYSSRARFVKIDIDRNPEIFAHYRSGGGIPQIMIFKNGAVVAEQKGFGGRDGLKQWLESSL